MPRIRQLETKYNEQDFQKAIFTAMVKCGLECSVRQLAIRTGMTQSMLNRKLRHEPLTFTAEDLRKIIPILQPDPGAILTLVGYTSNQIKKFKEG